MNRSDEAVLTEQRLEQRALRRKKRRRPTMRISGKSVFTLRRLLTRKSSLQRKRKKHR